MDGHEINGTVISFDLGPTGIVKKKWQRGGVCQRHVVGEKQWDSEIKLVRQAPEPCALPFSTCREVPHRLLRFRSNTAKTWMNT